MYLDLQGTQVELDLAREALLSTFKNDIYSFITQPSNYQAALDASEIPLLEAEIPEYPAFLRKATNKQNRENGQSLELSSGKSPEPSSEESSELSTELNRKLGSATPAATASTYNTNNTAIARAQYNGTELPDIGSNNWAVTGDHTATGAGLLANDMHLGLSLIHI